MNTGPEWLCQPLEAPTGNSMTCTARSKLGLAISSKLHCPVIHLDLNTFLVGSSNVVRPSTVPLEPEVSVNAGWSIEGSAGGAVCAGGCPVSAHPEGPTSAVTTGEMPSGAK